MSCGSIDMLIGLVEKWKGRTIISKFLKNMISKFLIGLAFFASQISFQKIAKFLKIPFEVFNSHVHNYEFLLTSYRERKNMGEEILNEINISLFERNSNVFLFF
jgi:hypothetical protein